MHPNVQRKPKLIYYWLRVGPNEDLNKKNKKTEFGNHPSAKMQRVLCDIVRGIRKPLNVKTSKKSVPLSLVNCRPIGKQAFLTCTNQANSGNWRAVPEPWFINPQAAGNETRGLGNPRESLFRKQDLKSDTPGAIRVPTIHHPPIYLDTTVPGALALRP